MGSGFAVRVTAVHYDVRVGRGPARGTLCYEGGAADQTTSNAGEVTCAKCCALMGRPVPQPKAPALAY